MVKLIFTSGQTAIDLQLSRFNQAVNDILGRAASKYLLTFIYRIAKNENYEP